MLSCREVTERASRYLDRELSWRERLQMRLHLMMCRYCTRFVDQLKATMELLRKVRLNASPDGADRLLEAMRAIKADRAK